MKAQQRYFGNCTSIYARRVGRRRKRICVSRESLFTYPSVIPLPFSTPVTPTSCHAFHKDLSSTRFCLSFSRHILPRTKLSSSLKCTMCIKQCSVKVSLPLSLSLYLFYFPFLLYHILAQIITFSYFFNRSLTLALDFFMTLCRSIRLASILSRLSICRS
jgi:hypothetical protein